MKESKYNIYFLDEKKKKALVYNTLRRSILRIDYEVFSCIRDNKIDQIDESVLGVLRAGRLIIDEGVDELDMVNIMLNRCKYTTVSGGVTIIPTHACNLACKYCYQGHGDVLSNTMNEETVRRTIAFLKKNCVNSKFYGITFYGGEPLLFPEIPFTILEEVAPFADENNIQLSVIFTSNGTLFTDKIAEKLNDFHHEVQITLCGPQEIHDQIRVDKKGHGTYERLMEVIELFRTYGTSFHIRVDVDQKNYDSIPLLLQDLLKRGFEGLFMNFCPIGKDVCYKEIEVDSRAVDVASLTRLSRMAHDMGFETNPIYIHNFVEGCSAIADNFLAIDPRGDVYKCIAAPNYPEHKLGTLDENGDLTDMNYEAYCKWTLRSPLLIKECVECKFAPICGGGCALTAYEKHGDINAPGCEGKEEKELEEIVRTFIMLKYPELFEGYTYERTVL